jgi:hypothetical protein
MVELFAPLLIDHMDVMFRKYGRCASSNAPRTERQSWKKCDLKRHISRQNKENIENLIQHF